MRKSNSLKEVLVYYYHVNYNNIINTIIIFAVIIGCICGGIAYKNLEVVEFTQEEINNCTEIGKKIISTKLEIVPDEIKGNANKNNYDINIDYLNSIITFSFRNEQKGDLILNFSSEEEVEINQISAIGNRIEKTLLAFLIGFIGGLAVLMIICSLLIQNTKNIAVDI